MNKVTLIGNIVADPKATLISNGNERSSFTIAVRDTKNYQETYFLPCVAWKPLSTFINTNIKKGDSVAIDGRLVRRPYTPMDGKTIYVTEVVVDSFETLLRRSSNNVSSVTMNSNIDTNVHNLETNSEFTSSDNSENNHSTNLDTVFSTSNYEDNNQDDSQNDDIDWDSEFN